ncbi:NACHT domain-containing protein [Streptomyces sp. NPDC001851]|uniref:NACHT domain-containing protein n=1 Tax=Streptomyces sp. NPDC001851 TaxID=3154529 RepID=UPI003321CB6D
MKERVLKWLVRTWPVIVIAGLSWYYYRHPVRTAAELATALALLAGLLGLPVLLFPALRSGKAAQTSTPLAALADSLAEAVRRQWEQEARVRSVNDPRPLSISWTSAGAGLVEPWPSLCDLAQSWPGGPPGEPRHWAAGPEGLAGRGAEIDQVFLRRIPTRRLVVLGDPGAGKTVLLILLLLALVEYRQPGDPVPVLFSLASWDPGRQDLYAWLADQLTRDHRALRALAPEDLARSSSDTLAHALLEGGIILPVLDGLDELPEALRPQALSAINRALPLRQSLVLSSRTAEYRDALSRSDGFGVALNGAAGIRLLPLDAAQATAYLQGDAGRAATAAAARWQRVIALLGTGAPSAQALSTPLGLFLARTIYNPRPGQHPADIAHPDELLDPTRFPTRAAVEAYLFAAFIPATYRPPTCWKPERAERTLKFLARHLEYTRHGTPDLAWWQLNNSLPRGTLALVAGSAAGLVAWAVSVLGLALIIGNPSGMWDFLLLFGLGLGLPVGLTTGFSIIRSFAKDREPSARISWTPGTKGIFRAVVYGVLIGISVGSASGFAIGLGAGLAGGFFTWLLAGITTMPPDPTTAVGPGQVLDQDRRTFWILTLLTGSVGGLVPGLAAGIAAGPSLSQRLAAGLGYGLMIATMVGLGFGCALSVWWRFVVVRFALAVLGKTPWRLMGFLADAHEHRGVLRQSGAVYQFRHRNLQLHLAAQLPQQPDSSGSGRDRPDRS